MIGFGFCVKQTQIRFTQIELLGRILIPLFLFLYEKDLLNRPTFYLSAYLESHREKYVNSLRTLGTNKDSWNDWIKFFLAALIGQAKFNTAKARSIMDLYEGMKARVIALTHSQFAVPLPDALFEQPIFKSSSLDGRPGMPSKPMVMTLLGKLKKEKILRVLRERAGRRAQILVFSQLVKLCEANTLSRKS